MFFEVFAWLQFPITSFCLVVPTCVVVFLVYVVTFCSVHTVHVSNQCVHHLRTEIRRTVGTSVLSVLEELRSTTCSELQEYVCVFTIRCFLS